MVTKRYTLWYVLTLVVCGVAGMVFGLWAWSLHLSAYGGRCWWPWAAGHLVMACLSFAQAYHATWVMLGLRSECWSETAFIDYLSKVDAELERLGVETSTQDELEAVSAAQEAEEPPRVAARHLIGSRKP